MSNYIIVGAGGLGREFYHTLKSFIQSQDKKSQQDEIIGFLDDNFFALSGYSGYPPILGEIEEYQPKDNDLLVLAQGVPKIKREVFKRLEPRGAKFATLIHPMASVGTNVSIGNGCHVGWHTCVSCDVTLGRFISLNCNLTVGHDAVIDDFVEVGPGCAISGFAHIEEGVHLGSGVVIAPGVRVGAWSKVCASSAVLRDVPPFSYVVGVPANTHRNFFKHPNEE